MGAFDLLPPGAGWRRRKENSRGSFAVDADASAYEASRRVHRQDQTFSMGADEGPPSAASLGAGAVVADSESDKEVALGRTVDGNGDGPQRCRWARGRSGLGRQRRQCDEADDIEDESAHLWKDVKDSTPPVTEESEDGLW